YAPGDVVTATFWSANPNPAFRTGNSYMEVQRKADDGWETVATDDSWSTRFTWQAHGETEGASQAALRWAIPEDAAAGSYRLIHRGQANTGEGSRAFEGTTRLFSVE